MMAFVALLRAVNVGGTGKLPMATLAELCVAAGFAGVRTYIASGNVVFCSNDAEDDVRRTLEDRISAHAGKSVRVLVRSASEIQDILARNPFGEAPSNRVMVLFVDGALPSDPLEGATGITDEQVRLGKRELFVLYPRGMSKARLRLPSEKTGTARNMNTVTRLAGMAATQCG